MLKFTPLEFETRMSNNIKEVIAKLKFTPLEFETLVICIELLINRVVKIYSVGV